MLAGAGVSGLPGKSDCASCACALAALATAGGMAATFGGELDVGIGVFTGRGGGGGGGPAGPVLGAAGARPLDTDALRALAEPGLATPPGAALGALDGAALGPLDGGALGALDGTALGALEGADLGLLDASVFADSKGSGAFAPCATASPPEAFACSSWTTMTLPQVLQRMRKIFCLIFSSAIE